MDWFRNLVDNWVWTRNRIIAAATLGGLLFFGIVIWSYLSGLQQTGVEHEQGLNYQYQSSQIELDTYTKKIYEGVQIANLQSDQMDRILRDAVTGRYDGKMEAQPGQGQLFSAIKEAYPQLDMSIYKRLIDLVDSGREAFKNRQNLMLDRIRAYQDWMNSGLFQPGIIRRLGFPSNNLEARIGTDVKYGREALERMKLIVTSDKTNQTFKTGKDEPVTVPGVK